VRSWAHHDDRDQERVFAADRVADSAEHERTEWAHRESGTEGCKTREGMPPCRCPAEKTMRRKHCKRAVQMKSNHSNTVPSDDAKINRRCVRSMPDAAGAITDSLATRISY
jgi:hypothetical protein